LRSTTRRIRDRSVMHVTHPTGDDRSVLSGKTWWTKPTLLAGDLTRLSLCGIQLPRGLPWELELMPDTRSPRTVNRHKIRHYFWRARISRVLLCLHCRSQWPRGLRRGPSASRLLGLWFRTPPGSWTSVSCECCVLSSRRLCVELITLPEETYKVWCVQWVWSRSPVRGGRGPEWGRSATGKKNPRLHRLASTSTLCNKTKLYGGRGGASRYIRNKKGDIWKVNLMTLGQTIRIKISKVCV
jgi:hypothetical protein